MKFEFQNPTQLIFGAGTLSRLGEVVSAHGKRALLVTGGGSVKRSGVFDRAVSSLRAAGVSVVECSGVEPNPRITSIVRGAQIARDEGCDVVIALGGGSTTLRTEQGWRWVNPAWMGFAAHARPDRFAQFAQRIFGLPAKRPDDLDCALEGVDRFGEFLRSIGCPTRLSQLGIGEAMLSRYARDTVRIVHDEEGLLPGRPPMHESEIVEVLRSAL